MINNMEEVIKRIILENQDLIAHKSVLKRKYIIPETKNITVLSGIRRCGKTYMLYELAQRIDIKRVLFLDFEDERLVTLNSMTDYDVIIDSYLALYPDLKPVLFFDEVQTLRNWHLYLKRLHVKGYKIYVAGSNANLLSRDIATYLKGRSLETTIYPFSFEEFLKLKGVHFSKKDMLTRVPRITSLFNEFMLYGGFPEVISAEKDDKRLIAKNIYNLLFYKDLVARYDKDDYLLKLTISKIVENITKEFSITSLAHKIAAIQRVSVPTITDYFNILPEPFLTYNVHQYRTSFIARESKRKTYLADNAFIYLNRVDPEKSRLFENMVFNFLQRQYGEIYYYKSKYGKEVDFFIKEGLEFPLLIQASTDLSEDDTRNREITSLSAAMDEQGASSGYIYTFNQSEELTIKEKIIKVVPLWREILEN
jgi:predicted AAA+ superfamily ATPase